MTNITTVKGYNANGEVVATATCNYNERFTTINEIMNKPEVAYITTATTIKR